LVLGEAMNNAVKNFFMSGFFVWIVAGIAIGGYLYISGKNKIKYGIDLVGGTYITLEVQEDDVIKNHLSDKIKTFQEMLSQSGIELEKNPVLKPQYLSLLFKTKTDVRDAELLFKKDAPKLKYVAQENELVVTVGDELKSRLMTEAVSGNIEILRSRFDYLSEIHISAQGEKQIVVELPNVSDPQQAKEMIGKSAILEFKLVEDSASSYEALLDKYDHDLPEGAIVLPGKSHGSRDREHYLLPEYTPVSGAYFKDAKADLGGEMGTDLVVSFEFDSEGGKRFYELTSENIGKMLAIVLDGEVIQVARIQSAIKNRGQISGSFDSEEANTLAKLLKSGSFKAKVNFIEERQIGPTLGQESISKGLFSCLLGLGLLLLLSLFYYRLSGFFACLALVYNLLVILFFLSLFGATLTLPGIAGMILTIGMAIDASILIYERIKEELALGKSINNSVAEGFSDAMLVILDANITTFLIAGVLFYFGTGPIQGFAVTMMIGIISTLITGLFFLKSLFKAYLRATNGKKISI